MQSLGGDCAERSGWGCHNRLVAGKAADQRDHPTIVIPPAISAIPSQFAALMGSERKMRAAKMTAMNCAAANDWATLSGSQVRIST